MLTRLRWQLVSVVALAWAPLEARAHSTGQFGYSGRNGVTCSSRCHVGSAAHPTLSVQLSPINSVLPPAAVGYAPLAQYTVTINVTGGPGVTFGFNADSSAGTGIVTQGAFTQHTSRSQEFTHRQGGTTRNQWSYT